MPTSVQVAAGRLSCHASEQYAAVVWCALTWQACANSCRSRLGGFDFVPAPSEQYYRELPKKMGNLLTQQQVRITGVCKGWEVGGRTRAAQEDGQPAHAAAGEPDLRRLQNVTATGLQLARG